MRLFWLGLKSIWHDRTLLVFCGASLAAVLGPLLLLYGFKFGIIHTLLEALRSDPAVRQVTLQGDYTLKPSDIEQIHRLPSVSFAQPVSRTLAARTDLQKSAGGPVILASLLPTGPGDPVMGSNVVLTPGEIALSFGLAERLRIAVGEEVKTLNRRTQDSAEEELSVHFKVAHIVPRGASIGDIAYVMPDFIITVEQFVDGYEVPTARLAGRSLAGYVPAFANIRLYASSIEDVASLTRALETAGYRVSSRAEEVAGVLGLNRSLAAIFTLIAAVGAVGYAVSLAANLAAAIAQKRKLLSLLRLMGAGPYALLQFPLAQGLAIAALGYLLAVGVFFSVSHVANQQFQGALQSGGEVCFLSGTHFAIAAIGTFGSVMLVIALVSRPLISLSPADVLYEG